MQRWRNQAQTDPQNREALRALISQMTAVRSSKALPAIIGCEKAVGLWWREKSLGDCRGDLTAKLVS
jgi:hypothetical protein